MRALSTETHFQQYKDGPLYPWYLFEENVKNHKAELMSKRRYCLSARRYESRVSREYNAYDYLQAKKSLEFLLSNKKPL